jgi:hypothetical protein
MEDDGTLVPGMFYADYPFWTLYDTSLVKTLGIEGSVVVLNPPGVGPILAIFFDEDLASRLIEFLGKSELKPLALPDPETVIRVAESTRRKGVNHVGEDMLFQNSKFYYTRRTLDEFIEAVRRGAV